jgi:hypothetical protein
MSDEELLPAATIRIIATDITNFFTLIILKGEPEAHCCEASYHEKKAPRGRYNRHDWDT